MKTLDIFYFSSTHWDREWYQSYQGFRYRLVKMVDKLLDIFEKDPDYKTFHFDGQTIVLEDYAQICPEKKEMLKKLICERRILVGPWYVMPDEFLLSGESLIRNLMKGHELAKEWGSEAWKYGYVCDIFGHTAQMPQIFNGFGIKYSILGRGTTESDPTYFKWQAPDGSECFTFKLAPENGYGDFNAEVYRGVENPSPDNPEIEKRIRAYIDREIARSNAPAVIIMDGLDHTEANPYTSAYLKKIAEMYPQARVHHCDLTKQGELLETVGENLPVLCGELNRTAREKHNYLHLITNTLSSHYPVKKANDECQNLLEKQAEPYCVFAKLEGISLNRNFVRLAYQYLMKNHPHDSICGCSIDQIYRDMEYRFSQVRELSASVLQDYLYRDKREETKEALYDEENILTLYNPLPFAVEKTISIDLFFRQKYSEQYSEPFGYEAINSFRLYDYEGREIPYQVTEIKRNVTHRIYDQISEPRDVHTVTFSAKLPPCGKAEYRVVPSHTPSRYFERIKAGENYAENEFLRLEILQNGNLTITDKRNGKVYENIGSLVDDGEIGDGWYHVNPVCDRVLSSCGGACAIEKTEHGPNKCVFRITRYMEVPAEMTETRFGQARSEQTVSLKFVSFVSLTTESKYVDVKMSYENTAKDHRLRMLLPTGIVSDSYFAGEAFCVLNRKTGIDVSTQDWLEPDQYEKAFNGIVGKRDENGNGIALVFAGGVHECAGYADEEGTLAVTLSRSFRKTHLTNGETKCQLNTLLSYHYHISLLEDDVSYADLIREQDVMSTKFGQNFVSVSKGTPLLAPQSNLFVSGENVVTSVVKCAEADDGIIVRVFNPSETETSADIVFSKEMKKAELVNLNEEKQAGLSVCGNRVSVPLLPWKIQTVKIFLA